MPLLGIVALAAAALGLAYFTYGRWLSAWLRLRDDSPTPAVSLRDDLDFVPIDRGALLSQHFSAIAAAGPIVGPIAAGLMFGWLPALLWIVVGSIFIGGVHDLTALVASVRHRARSIAEVVREHMTQKAYLLFLAFIWLALVYVIVAFTDITAGTFFGRQTLENGAVVSGSGIATSSMLYLGLSLLLGFLLRFTRVSLVLWTLIFLPLVGFSIWTGQRAPLEVASLLGLTDGQAHRVWISLLLIYCGLASMAPMWLLLQPRGHLGGWFLLLALVGGTAGVILGNFSVPYPAFIGWKATGGEMLMPVLFITIACGACSGFHAMVASGTTSKQLRRESDARPVAYGGMLLEGMVAVLSLACVMVLPAASSLATGAAPNTVYAAGLGSFLGVLGIPLEFAVSFALLAFATFIFDTLDVCTRLGRYVLQELLGWHSRWGGAIATLATIAAPLYFLLNAPVDAATGKAVPAWRVFWGLFGASNQLLAALTLVGVTVWLWRTRRDWRVWLVAGAPAAFMYVISVWELLRSIFAHVARLPEPRNLAQLGPVPWVASILVLLAFLMLVEALRMFGRSQPPAPIAEPA